MKTLINLIMVISLLMITNLPTKAQNLTASQMNIYFGSPKKVSLTNSQGTIVTEFDRNGRIIKITQGNMSMTYDWADNGKEVTLSMYQGANYQDYVNIKIQENTPSRLKYTIGNTVTMDISFKKNGGMEKVTMINPQMSGTMTYFYKSESDIYPYAIEQSAGNQSGKMNVTINETDSYGNAIVFTQEFMGNKDVSKLIIEYY